MHTDPNTRHQGDNESALAQQQIRETPVYSVHTPKRKEERYNPFYA